MKPTEMISSEILIYQNQEGNIKVEVRLEDETVWLSQDQMALLFGKAKSTINEHILNVYQENELAQGLTMRKIGNSDFSTKPTNYYNLDVIISVGYRVKSPQGTQFRIWATQRLKEYIIKGFVMDDDRLKNRGNGHYFDELLERIRDIRSSEKMFWRTVLDIYATSVDYDPNLEVTKKFFATLQNKMHWAAHGQTAAEVIFNRVDSNLPNMGLTNWMGDTLRKKEIEIAKNYLNPDELNILNRIVTLYLEYAELQALNRKPMMMQDWINKLDDFLKLSGRELLTHSGMVSHEEALQKAHAAYDQFSEKRLNEPSRAEIDFLTELDMLEKSISQQKRRKTE